MSDGKEVTVAPAADTTATDPVKSTSNDPPAVPYHRLFRFADAFDIAVLVVGSIGSAVNGATLPAFSILFGSLLNHLKTDNGDFGNAISGICQAFVVVGCISFVVSLLEMPLMNVSATRQIKKVRTLYFQALMRQDIGWYDLNTAGDLAARLAENTIQMYGGMGQKLGNTIHNASTLVFGFGVGFYYNYKLAFLILGFTPIMAICAGMMKASTDKYENLMKKAYASAATTANNALSAIRTVTAFGNQDVEVDKYSKHLGEAQKAGEAKGLATGIAMGCMYGTVFIVYGVGLWFGAWLIVQSDHNPQCASTGGGHSGCFNGGDVMLVFFAVIMGAFSIGQVGPNFGAFATAQASAARIFQVIDRVPTIDVHSPDGVRIQSADVKGAISFKNVTFSYPSRPAQTILDNFSLDIAPGETVAFVGESGSGKSTILQLLQRFYDPKSGVVEIDGQPIHEMNVKSLRSLIGIVSQEPALFAMSIRDNIALGAIEDDVSEDRIKTAAAMASATEFIDRLQEGYNTQVGERGAQLSGGQKQRIAIARAILRNPAFLLLDEATSALDSRSEREVQAALDQLIAGSGGASRRTTLMIAHRLSTVANVDRIVVLSHGKVVEVGPPQELMAREDGYYRKLLAMQNVVAVEETVVAPADATVTVPTAYSEAATPGLQATEESLMIKKQDSNSSKAGAAPVVVSEEDKKKKVLSPGELDVKPVAFSRIWTMQSGEKFILFLAFGAALINGGTMPAFSIIFASMMNIFYDTDTTTLMHKAIFLMGMFFLIGGVAGICYFLQPFLFSLAGERLTRRLRVDTFRAIMRQDMVFFDNPKNNVGALATRLSGDAALVQATTGPQLGVSIQNMCALLAALGIALWSSWMLTLVVLGTMPAMVAAGMAMMKFVKGNDKDASFLEAGAISAEAVTNIRTVTSFSLQDKLLARFDKSLQSGIRHARASQWLGGGFFGFAQFLIFGTYALCFWAGSKFIAHGWISFEDMLRCFFALAMSSWSVGENSQLAANQGIANAAKESLFSIIDRVSAVDPYATEGAKPESCRGEIEFRGVTFAYPNRPQVKVLKRASFTIKAGDMVAFVGASGCGKSTIIRLVLRYYDVTEGQILLDGVDIRTLNVKWLREQFGLVSQEPDLFPDTLEYNIQYGDPHAELQPSDTSKGIASVCKSATEVSASVVEAARSANAANFIDEFALKYGTRAGEMGSQLSGGQKQRVAIARAIIRQPHVLLLDEATSALDSESERIVQQALDGLVSTRFSGVTTIVIAHRLSTIRNSNVIIVLHNGEVAEMGDHTSLLQNPDGRYAKLIQAQQVTAAEST